VRGPICALGRNRKKEAAKSSRKGKWDSGHGKRYSSRIPHLAYLSSGMSTPGCRQRDVRPVPRTGPVPRPTPKSMPAEAEGVERVRNAGCRNCNVTEM